MEVSLTVEVPIGADDARRRGIPIALSRINLRASSGKDAEIVLNRILEGNAKDETRWFACAVGEFDGNPPSRASTGGPTGGVRQLGADALSSQFSTGAEVLNWDAEAVIVFRAKPDIAVEVLARVERLNERWWAPSAPGHEAKFLKQLDLTDPFIFFAKSHLSIEIIGTQTALAPFVTRALEFCGGRISSEFAPKTNPP